MSEGADEFGGQAFVTEYAAPSSELAVVHPLLQELRGRHPYVTRLNTVISPEEMTVDPVFGYDLQRKDVSNIRDLSNMTGLFECERLEGSSRQMETASVESPAATDGAATRVTGESQEEEVPTPGEPTQVERDVSDAVPYWGALVGAGAIGGAVALLAAGLVALAIMRGRRVRGQ